MASNFKTLLLGLSLSACSAANSDRFQIGQQINQTDPNQLQLVQTDDTTQFYLYDSYAHRINFVDATRQTLEFSRDLGENSKGRFWLATQQDGYYFDVKDNLLSLTTQEGASSQRLVQMAGKIISYAADFKQGYFAFIDEFFSIALIKMNSQGQVLSTWRGGAVIDGLNTVAGEMLDGGHLILVTDLNQMLDIDIEATLQDQSWSYASHSMATTAPNWVGRVEASNERALVLESRTIHLIDRTSGSTLASKSLPSAYTVVPSKQGLDHVYYYDTATDKINIIYADSADTLRTLPIKMNGTYPVQTYFAPTRLTVRSSTSKVLQIDIHDSDAVVTTSQDINDKNAVMGLGSGMAAAMYDSPLGYIRLYNLDAGSEQNFSGFNLKTLQGQ